MSAPLALWLDGALADSARPAFTPLERGLTYGEGLFETLAVAGGRALDVEEHLERLTSSANALGFPAPAESAIAAGIEACLAAARAATDHAGVVRITLTRGSGARGYAPGPDDGPARLMIAAFAAREALVQRAERGVRAVSVSGCAPGDLARHKSTSALHYVIAASRARARGADEALLLESRGRVLESAGANLFLVLDGVIVTPPVSLPLLPGLMRRRVLLGLGSGDGLERAFDAGTVGRAEEAFLTNAVEGVVPLVEIDGRAIGTGAPGPRTRALQDDERARRTAIAQPA